MKNKILSFVNEKAISPGSDYNIYQKYLRSIFRKNRDLKKVLDVLYKQQVKSGFIRRDVLKYVNNISKIKTKSGRVLCYLQHNPPRAKRGISPKKNPNPINILPGKNIPCFCCEENIKVQWPKERGFTVKINREQYIFYANPAPIFNNHFVLVSKKHKPMKMDIAILARVMRKLPGMCVAQNGPGAGASNPWHFHLQILKGDFPIEQTKAKKVYTKNLGKNTQIKIEELDYPFHVLRIKFARLNRDTVKYLQELQDKYLALDKNNRLTYMGKKKAAGDYEIYFTLRNIKNKTKLYSESVGFPEPLGFLCTPYTKEKKAWLSGGHKRYGRLLRDLNVSDELYKKFITVF
ncbi:DUF4922 domain-containing protein [Candidatus Margulisiibacteriota bacterium]